MYKSFCVRKLYAKRREPPINIECFTPEKDKDPPIMALLGAIIMRKNEE